MARRTGYPVAFVIAVWAQLLERASASNERGCIDGYDCEGADVSLGLPDGAACAIGKGLKDKGLIDEYRVCKWEQRQVKREREPEPPGSSTERVREHRAKKREGTGGNGPQRDETPCNDMKRPVTVRNNLEEIREEEKKEECVFNAGAREEAPEGDASGLSGKAGASSRQPPVAFDEFFEAFPERHRGGRNEAAGEWVALEANRALPGLSRILDALGQWEDSEAWKRQGGRYVPSAANFLKREYWLRKPPEPEERGDKGEQARPRANTVAQQQTRDNDDMAKMLLQARRAKHAQSELHASIAGQSGPALPAGR